MSADHGKKRKSRRDRRQQTVAAILAIILVGAMVLTLVPTFFM